VDLLRGYFHDGRGTMELTARMETIRNRTLKDRNIIEP
jgi:hypothetical protein